VLGHNIAKFDSEVSELGMGVKIPDKKIRDSLFSRFIVDPRAKSLSLKPAPRRCWASHRRSATRCTSGCTSTA
jgi:hypothetical protein